MSTALNDALEMATWVANATPEQVIARLLMAEKEALMWSMVEASLTPDRREALEQTATLLRESGYRRPER